MTLHKYFFAGAYGVPSGLARTPGQPPPGGGYGTHVHTYLNRDARRMLVALQANMPPMPLDVISDLAYRAYPRGEREGTPPASSTLGGITDTLALAPAYGPHLLPPTLGPGPGRRTPDPTKCLREYRPLLDSQHFSSILPRFVYDCMVSFGSSRKM